MSQMKKPPTSKPFTSTCHCLHLNHLGGLFMRKSILAVLISAGLLAEGVVPVVNAATTSKTKKSAKTTRSSRNRSRGRRRLRNTAIGAAGGAAGGAILGGGRGAGAGAAIGGTAGALTPTRRSRGR